MLDRLLGSDIEVSYELDPEPCPVEVDAGQIEQVILNLAVNASDAMPQGGRIALHTESACRGGPAGLGGEEEGRRPPATWVVLTVEDTGCGMDSETLRHIFEPFFTTKEKGKGTGLGLSTVYGIVKQSGGDITVESRPGRGTGFRIYLPRAAAPATAEPAAPAMARAASAAPVRGSETVLVVEDDEMFRGLLAEILSAQGYEVLAASDPAEALERCQRHPSPIHLVVSDMVMPGMTGRELAWRLADRYPDVKICLMSGYSEEALAERGLSDPAVPVIQKPFSTRDFLSRIRRLLDEDEAPEPS
jgi:CheY-like chemotaxis protein